MDLVLSTSWNAFRHLDGQKLIFEIKGIGYQQVELSFNLTLKMVRQIEKLVKNGGIKVTSLHNYCPIPSGLKREDALPDCYAMSSLDSAERKKAVAQTKNTITWAQRLGAKAVVLHCGRVEIPDFTRRLIYLYSNNLKNSRAFKETKKLLIETRGENCQKHLYNTLSSLEEINKFAAKSKILLGIENRFYYREIPSFSEIGVILKNFPGSNINYWHDTGHAQIMENLGFVKHAEFLRSYSHRLLGVHLHDVIGCSDHHAPGEGSFNFRLIKPFLKEDTLKVIEAHYHSAANKVKKAKSVLNKVLS